MARDDDTDDRVQLCQALWELRCGIARLGDASANKASFGRMLTDPGYRARVIQAVRESATPELQRLAENARRCNAGRLSETPVSWDAAGRTELDIETLTRDAGTRPPGLSRVAAAGATTVLLVCVIAGSVLGYLFSGPLVAALSADKRVQGEISASTTWETGRTYVLSGKVYVTDGATLTIERGTRVLGRPGSALIVTRDGKIQSQGSKNMPVVFSSSRPAGQRGRGDWGGVVLLGNAPVNASEPHVEGIPSDDIRGHFGGDDPNSSCGVLKYTRIEFAGYEIGANVELNGLTLGGCGRGTVVRNVQVHMGLDDGIEVFGGTVNLERALVTRAADDSLDWDLGWTGNAQFVVLQQEGGAGDHAIEADSNRDDHDATPRSAPTLSNVTLIGSRRQSADQRAILLRRGTGADLRNVIAAGFPSEFLDVRGQATAELADTGQLRIAGLIAHDIGSDRHTWSAAESSMSDDDGGFGEGEFLRASKADLGTNPGLPKAAFNLLEPKFAPHLGSPVEQGVSAIPDGEFWDRSAKYLGAFKPGSGVGWLEGWTAFPPS